ncbi:hypothetical protein E1301_Tti019447 [Triplophysa tibetana]|uniref:C-type lectin domain-containing protein n=1 Tax=Triplophysa tibetana TaxID=1572043 RepID=A0A5A9PLE7_9TELE|nr:hypothetical protein E1301_Tti019447 [Triplophysa tibetana]
MKKTWTEAQIYCKTINYTDLATVNNINDMKQLKNTVKNNKNFWIGLKNTGVYKWKWSLGDPVNYTNWEPGATNDRHDCAVMMRNGKWHHQKCNERSQFICYNGFCTEIINVQGQWNDAGCSKYKPFLCQEVIPQDSNSSMSETTPADNGTQKNLSEADEKLQSKQVFEAASKVGMLDGSQPNSKIELIRAWGNNKNVKVETVNFPKPSPMRADVVTGIEQLKWNKLPGPDFAMTADLL